ncbi:hypothetical protein KKA15_00920 [Patescibacteria group bacterium]|nr:hypothetical protein [Patescibacteria group bacterium]
MGKMISNAAFGDERFSIYAEVEHPDHPSHSDESEEKIDSDLRDALTTYQDHDGKGRALVVVSAVNDADTAAGHAAICTEFGVAYVCGTTGLDDIEQETLKAASKHIPLVYSTNMNAWVIFAIGTAVNFMKLFGKNVLLEIIDVHHGNKPDSPSGTAVTLYEMICLVAGRCVDVVIFGRHGKLGPRTFEEIAVHALRAGKSFLAEHEFRFYHPDLPEKFVITHSAQAWENYADGFLQAAMFAAENPNGMYTQFDVCGFKI